MGLRGFGRYNGIIPRREAALVPITTYSAIKPNVKADDCRRNWELLKTVGVLPGGAASGELAGTYPSPTVADNVIDAANLKSDAVTTVKILDGNVTIAKLADAAQDLIPQITISRSAASIAALSNLTFTVQVQDAAGNSLTGTWLIHIWFGTGDKGAPTAGITFGTFTAGTQFQAVSANQDYLALTNSSGTLAFTATSAVPATIYVMASMPKVVSIAGVWT